MAKATQVLSLAAALENSNGFHAPQEAVRILGEAIDFARRGQLALRPAPGTARSVAAR